MTVIRKTRDEDDALSHVGDGAAWADRDSRKGKHYSIHQLPITFTVPFPIVRVCHYFPDIPKLTPARSDRALGI